LKIGASHAVHSLLERLDQAAFQLLPALRCIGLYRACSYVDRHGGKSGHIGKKIAATLATPRTPSLLWCTQVKQAMSHGMITRQDVVIALSQLRQYCRGA